MVPDPTADDDDAVAAALAGSGGDGGGGGGGGAPAAAAAAAAAAVSSTVSSSLYGRGGAIESLLARSNADQESWVFDVSVVAVVAIAGVFLLATLLVLLGLVYLFRKHDDARHWRAFGSQRFESDLFSSATDVDERGSLCDGMGRQGGAADAVAAAAGDSGFGAGGGGVPCATVLCDRCSRPVQLCSAPLEARRPPPLPKARARPDRTPTAPSSSSSSSSREAKRKASTPARSKTMWQVGRRVGDSESLMPLIATAESRTKSRSYEMLKEAEVADL